MLEDATLALDSSVPLPEGSLLSGRVRTSGLLVLFVSSFPSKLETSESIFFNILFNAPD